MTDQLTRTGVLRIRRNRRSLLDILRGRTPQLVDVAAAAPAATPEPSQEATVEGHIYASSAPEPGLVTTALGRHHVPEKPVRELSPGQTTRRIPLLERTLAALGLPEEEALIYEQLAGQWHSGATNEAGPAFDHSGDAVRLPAIDQEGAR